MPYHLPYHDHASVPVPYRVAAARSSAHTPPPAEPCGCGRADREYYGFRTGRTGARVLGGRALDTAYYQHIVMGEVLTVRRPGEPDGARKAGRWRGGAG